jgi:hypothetical protein
MKEQSQQTLATQNAGFSTERVGLCWVIHATEFQLNYLALAAFEEELADENPRY